MEECRRGSENEFESSKVNEPSVFESSRFYCSYLNNVDSENIIIIHKKFIVQMLVKLYTILRTTYIDNQTPEIAQMRTVKISYTIQQNCSQTGSSLQWLNIFLIILFDNLLK